MYRATRKFPARAKADPLQYRRSNHAPAQTNKDTEMIDQTKLTKITDNVWEGCYVSAKPVIYDASGPLEPLSARLHEERAADQQPLTERFLRDAMGVVCLADHPRAAIILREVGSPGRVVDQARALDILKAIAAVLDEA